MFACIISPTWALHLFVHRGYWLTSSCLSPLYDIYIGTDISIVLTHPTFHTDSPNPSGSLLLCHFVMFVAKRQSFATLGDLGPRWIFRRPLRKFSSNVVCRNNGDNGNMSLWRETNVSTALLYNRQIDLTSPSFTMIRNNVNEAISGIRLWSRIQNWLSL